MLVDLGKVFKLDFIGFCFRGTEFGLEFSIFYTEIDTFGRLFILLVTRP